MPQAFADDDRQLVFWLCKWGLLGWLFDVTRKERTPKSSMFVLLMWKDSTVMKETFLSVFEKRMRAPKTLKNLVCPLKKTGFLG